ncbi:MAG: [FeFe] hydrogenase H-cluster radical SAM maturase HydE [Candidatus Omnitrophota bacterium]|nr:[FeFe] hydrogenase H-cluster radical SAM maturase HydE [Candidatus Omnitrophota bacterium]
MEKEIFTSDLPEKFEKPSGARIAGLLKTGDKAEIERLFLEADNVRRMYAGDEVHLRGIINFSNYCEKNCLYCGLRKDNSLLRRYRMEPEEIFDAARTAGELGCRTVVLQSGEDRFYSAGDLCSLVRRVKEELDLAVTISIGELSFAEYEKLKKAGADRYFLKFETSDPALYKTLKPDGSYSRRFEALRRLGELGFQVGSGIMAGLPGQSPESIARDILLFDELGLGMVGNGPFIPHPRTPLKNAAEGGLLTSLKIVALTRLVTLNAHIPATTALGTVHTEGRRKAFQCGANVIMPDVTPGHYREHYQIYPRKTCMNDAPRDHVDRIRQMLESMGRVISKDHGHCFSRGF